MKVIRNILMILLIGAIMTAYAGCAPIEAVDFQMNVVPESLQGLSIPGQRCVFLVTISNLAAAPGQIVQIGAEADGAEIIVENSVIEEGQVSEVTVIPDLDSIGRSIDLIITGQRDNLIHTAARTFEVIEGEDQLCPYAETLQSKFIKYLAHQHPDLGITEQTVWTPTIVSPQWLVVSHYLFLSEEWEMHLQWHIMIAPHDWARIDLRHRFDETKPSYAFEISSLTADGQPHAFELPETIWR